ncbi:MAG: endonuclease/exonuclease/phosphatase family protein [Nevskiales bacterium]|nr:endonuclease/exonuclease/phosphatase family protein [Nevskiales bacterium]
MTLNLHKGFSSFNRRFVLRELREAIRGAGADLVFLQEVIGAHDAHARRYPGWPETAQYEFLADSVWGSYAYGRNAVYEGGHHGNAVLSRYPIATYRNHDVSVAGEEPRGMLHCEIAVPGLAVPLHAICVHLGLRERDRERQIRGAADLVADRIGIGAPVVLAGDFNDWRQRAHRVLAERAALSEVFLRHRGRAARSFPALWPLLRLDRIYTRHLRVMSASVLSRRPWRSLSDHAALICRLRPC